MRGPDRMTKIGSVPNSKKLFKLFSHQIQCWELFRLEIIGLSIKSSVLRPSTYLLDNVEVRERVVLQNGAELYESPFRLAKGSFE